jgi:hypothetical protein
MQCTAAGKGGKVTDLLLSPTNEEDRLCARLGKSGARENKSWVMQKVCRRRIQFSKGVKSRRTSKFPQKRGSRSKPLTDPASAAGALAQVVSKIHYHPHRIADCVEERFPDRLPRGPDRARLSRKIRHGAGWPTGLEPATARTTIWGSTIELWPPSRSDFNFFAPNCKGKATVPSAATIASTGSVGYPPPSLG